MLNPIDIVRLAPNLNTNYTTKESSQNTVAILGSSADSDLLDKYLKVSSDITRHFIEKGYNVVSGCGSKGIMGIVYNTAANYSKKDSLGKPIQNLAIVMNPPYGDENLLNCVLIGKANSESERISRFSQVADNFIIFPGSTTTLQETATLIQKNCYLCDEEPKKIILVGTKFWEGLILQYRKLFDMKFLKEDPIGKLFHVVNSKKEVLKLILRK